MNTHSTLIFTHKYMVYAIRACTLHSQDVTIYNIYKMDCLVPFLLDPIKCLKLTNYSVCSYVSHKVFHVTQSCYVFIGPRSSSLTTNSLRMSASVHETLVPQKSIISVSAHETQVQSELQPYFISSHSLSKF